MRIPRFTAAELEGVVQLLSSEAIPFELEGVTVGATGWGATTEYYLLVNEADFVATCALLMDYYNIDSGTEEPFEGTCPACHSEVAGTLECPDCGLHFGFETPTSMQQHPFYKFLEEHGLLPTD